MDYEPICRNRQQNECILILYDTTEGTEDVGRIECHNVHILRILVLSDNYNVRGGRTEILSY